MWSKKAALGGALCASFIFGCARPAAQAPTTVEPLRPQAAAQVMIEGSSLVLIEEAGSSPLVVFFGVDSDVVDPATYPSLDALAEFLDNHGGQLRIEAQGHADERGSDTYNNGLSLRRARAVERYLVERGVDPTRVSATGFGERRPVSSDAESPHGRNRRVEFVAITDPLSDALSAAH